MNESICGAACHECGLHSLCSGCAATCGKPFGKACFVAQYLRVGGKEQLNAFQQQLIQEFNELHIPGMPEVTALIPLNGRFINMPYRLPNGQQATFLDDDSIYLGTRLPCAFDDSQFFGIAAGPDFLLVSLCADDGRDAELILYRKR